MHIKCNHPVMKKVLFHFTTQNTALTSSLPWALFLQMCSLTPGKGLNGKISDSCLELSQYLPFLNRTILCYFTHSIQDFSPRKMRTENTYSPLMQHTVAYKVQHCTFPYSTHRCFPTISYRERSMQNKVLSLPLFKQKPSAITPTMLHKDQMSLDPCPH